MRSSPAAATTSAIALLDGVPQFDDGEPGQARVGEPLQLGHEVLAQGAARAVVDQRRLSAGEHAGGVPDGAEDRAALSGGGQVVVERHAARDGGQEPFDGGPAGVGVQPADDRDGQGDGGHQRTPRCP